MYLTMCPGSTDSCIWPREIKGKPSLSNIAFPKCLGVSAVDKRQRKDKA